MQHGNDNTTLFVVPPIQLGSDLWDTISRLAAVWIDAARSRDHARALSTEQELRFFVLVYTSLPLDTEIVTTGRKAILRALYADFGGDDTGHVEAMIDRVIAREERLARRQAERGTHG